jgi:plastocyanin
MNRGVSEPTGRHRGVSHDVRWAILIGVAVVVVAFALVSLWVGRAPGRPAGITGKLVNHGTVNVREGTRVTVVLGARSFNPTFLRGPAGTRFLVHLQAEGFHAHSFTVPSLGIDVTLPPGGVADVSITIPEAATSVFYCRFHRPLGMQGAILVTGM